MITNPDCLLARVLLGKYCHKTSLLKVKPSKGASHRWTGILAGRDLLISQLGRVIGDGTEIKVWQDSWISTSAHCIPFGPIKEGDSDLRVSDLLGRGTCEWNKDMVTSILPDFAEDIFKLKPSKTGARDSYIWYAANSRHYSTKSGYAAAMSDRSQNSIPKLQLFLWKATKGALPTGDNLRKRGMLLNTNCIHCGMVETTKHIFLHCPFARQVWSLIPIATDFDSMLIHSFTDALTAAANWQCLPPCGITGDLFSWVCWNIWTSRNKLLFEKRPASTLLMMTKALSDAREWTIAQGSAVKPSLTTQIQRRPPSLPPDTVICNTDAAWKAETSAAGLAWIFDSLTPLLISSGHQHHHQVPSAIMAEALAVRGALSHALHLGISKVWLRSDSLSLIRAIESISKPMQLYGILSDIVSLSSSFSFCFFSFIPRVENGLTDNLAKACLSNVITSWA
ncbi:uncharacterized protein LOC130496884 [Raphanus sativus]|uniref:Uncharacterized protein LOC130496884 n=1 Tax=Raphanus sativus TaxID=3726 RepID=A0A9W3C224_RAPSA|nr:uncharacterized protein LOC130496884 [Raphanus sativus]